MTDQTFSLSLLEPKLAICKLDFENELPQWALASSFISFFKSADEVSLVCEERVVPKELDSERDWRALKVDGPLAFELTGVLAHLAQSIARIEVSIFAISTYDTDYILIKDNDVESAIAALRADGHTIHSSVVEG